MKDFHRALSSHPDGLAYFACLMADPLACRCEVNSVARWSNRAPAMPLWPKMASAPDGRVCVVAQHAANDRMMYSIDGAEWVVTDVTTFGAQACGVYFDGAEFVGRAVINGRNYVSLVLGRPEGEDDRNVRAIPDAPEGTSLGIRQVLADGDIQWNHHDDGKRRAFYTFRDGTTLVYPTGADASSPDKAVMIGLAHERTQGYDFESNTHFLVSEVEATDPQIAYDAKTGLYHAVGWGPGQRQIGTDDQPWATFPPFLELPKIEPKPDPKPEPPPKAIGPISAPSPDGTRIERLDEFILGPPRLVTGTANPAQSVYVQRLGQVTYFVICKFGRAATDEHQSHECWALRDGADIIEHAWDWSDTRPEGKQPYFFDYGPWMKLSWQAGEAFALKTWTKIHHRFPGRAWNTPDQPGEVADWLMRTWIVRHWPRFWCGQDEREVVIFAYLNERFFFARGLGWIHWRTLEKNEDETAIPKDGWFTTPGGPQVELRGSPWRPLPALPGPKPDPKPDPKPVPVPLVQLPPFGTWIDYGRQLGTAHAQRDIKAGFTSGLSAEAYSEHYTKAVTWAFRGAYMLAPVAVGGAGRSLTALLEEEGVVVEPDPVKPPPPGDASLRFTMAERNRWTGNIARTDKAKTETEWGTWEALWWTDEKWAAFAVWYRARYGKGAKVICSLVVTGYRGVTFDMTTDVPLLLKRLDRIYAAELCPVLVTNTIDGAGEGRAINDKLTRLLPEIADRVQMVLPCWELQVGKGPSCYTADELLEWIEIVDRAIPDVWIGVEFATPEDKEDPVTYDGRKFGDGFEAVDWYRRTSAARLNGICLELSYDLIRSGNRRAFVDAVAGCVCRFGPKDRASADKAGMGYLDPNNLPARWPEGDEITDKYHNNWRTCYNLSIPKVCPTMEYDAALQQDDEASAVWRTYTAQTLGDAYAGYSEG